MLESILLISHSPSLTLPPSLPPPPSLTPSLFVCLSLSQNLSTHSLDRSHIHHSTYAVDNISHYNEDFRDETFIIKVHINLSQYRLGIPYNICSLESIGIIPNRC